MNQFYGNPSWLSHCLPYSAYISAGLDSVALGSALDLDTAIEIARAFFSEGSQVFVLSPSNEVVYFLEYIG